MQPPEPRAHSKRTDAGFAPSDLTDGRRPYDWQSRYPKEARQGMWIEAIYLIAILFLAPFFLLVIGADCPKRLLDWFNYSINDEIYGKFVIYANAWLGGSIGGTLFSMKWLYHSRAKGLWNKDRCFWRYFSPHLSGGLSFGFMVLVSSGFLVIFDAARVNQPSLALGVGFIVGYFSDKAIAKLAEVADTIFGSAKKGGSGVRTDVDNKPVPPTDIPTILQDSTRNEHADDSP